MKYKSMLILTGSLIALQVVDVVSTYVCLNNGLGYESNPVAAWMIGLGWEVLLMLKVGVCLVIADIYNKGYSKQDQYKKIYLYSFIFINLFYVFVAANNLYIMFELGIR